MANDNLAYDNLIVYYFSGTGNARKSAEWICGFAEEYGLKTRLVNIDRFREINYPQFPQGKTLTGLCYPTHGFNCPPIIMRFLWKLKYGNGNHIFLLNTRAGMKLSKIFLPGLSGMAMLFPALWLLVKGYKLRAMRPVDLPSNWISLHPGLKKSVVDSLFGRWHRKLRIFTNKLVRGRKMYPNLISLPFDLAIMPVSIGYYFFGRFMIAKTFLATSACTSCNLCEKRCPTGSIRMIGGRPYWKFSCESCMRCMNICPHRAIETTHSISGLLWYLCWSLIPGWGLYLLFSYGLIQPGNRWIGGVVYYAITIPVSFGMIYIAYRLLRWAMRYRLINDIVSYTSFTHYKFWRRYKPG